MILHEVQQGSDEWKKLRLGIPTASNFDRIVTPARLEYSKGARTYINELVAEYLMGNPLDDGNSAWMDRGTELEGEARAWYAMDRDIEIKEVGFATTDDGKVGASPDGYYVENGKDIGVEIKCYGAAKHVGCLLGEDITTPGQTQGGLWVTGWDAWDVVAYCPDFPPVVTRVYPTDTWQDAFTENLALFLRDLDAAKAHVMLLGAKGRREDGASPLERLRASIETTGRTDDYGGEPMTLDEIDDMRSKLFVAVKAGAISQESADWTAAEAIEGMWDSARERLAEAMERLEAGEKVEVAV